MESWNWINESSQIISRCCLVVENHLLQEIVIGSWRKVYLDEWKFVKLAVVSHGKELIFYNWLMLDNAVFAAFCCFLSSTSLLWWFWQDSRSYSGWFHCLSTKEPTVSSTCFDSPLAKCLLDIVSSFLCCRFKFELT